MELEKITAAAAAGAIRNKEITAREVTEFFLSRCCTVNSTLNSFLHIFEDEALQQADTVDQKIYRGEVPLPLAGVPVALQDDLCYREAPTTCGAAALQSFRPPYNAFAVQQLIDAGAVIVGKTNLDQFGLGSSTASSFTGPTLNPWDTDKAAGDGSAAAVAAGQCLLALSSDSGGSLRIGASHCGLYGLRPTTGLVSRHGLNTFAPSFARVGLAARDAADANIALKVIAGYDPRDSSTASVKDSFPADNKISLNSLKIGYPRTVFDQLENPTRDTLEKAREPYTAAGAVFVEISLPLFQEGLLAYYVIAAAEASSNLGRFDGIRFGTPAESSNLEELYAKTRSSTFSMEGKRRCIIGTHLLNKDNFDLYYRQAQKVWNLVRQSFNAALENCDLIALPVVFGPAGTAAAYKDFLEGYREDLFCAPVSLSGLPALCVPAGEVESLPVGLQLVGKPFCEEALTQLAARTALPLKLSPAGVR